MDRKLRSGWPSASHSRAMFSSPSLMPKVSSAKRRSNTQQRLLVDCGAGSYGHRRGLRRTGRLGAHEAQRARDGRLDLAAVHDEVQHAVVEKELTALETFRELLPDC